VRIPLLLPARRYMTAQQRTAVAAATPSAAVAFVPSTPKVEEADEREGYCECCKVRYKIYREHVLSTRHVRFADLDENYKGIDDLLRLQHQQQLLPQQQHQQQQQQQQTRVKQPPQLMHLQTMPHTQQQLTQLQQLPMQHSHSHPQHPHQHQRQHQQHPQLQLPFSMPLPQHASPSNTLPQ